MPELPDPELILQDHPRKTSLLTTDVDSTHKADTGWVKMTVRFIATKDHLGTKHSVFGHSVMPPGSRHETHRHPNAEETIFMLQGKGVYRIGDDWVEMEAGDAAVVPPDVPHGFWNSHDTEDVVMVWTYSGASSLEEAGYIHVPDS